jgi:ATP-dependent DNA ligase
MAEPVNQDISAPIEEAKTDERHKMVCVILGYRLDSKRQVTALILGANHQDKLSYAGVVNPPAEDASLIDIVDDLEQLQVAEPHLSLDMPAIWVKPEYVCQVSYATREPDGRLVDVKWEKLRGSLRMPFFARPASSTGSR